MTKPAALHAFFNSFGIPAFLNTSIPNYRDAEMPYITYQYVANGFSGGAVFPTVQIWYKTSSEAIPNAKADDIYNRIGEGLLLECDDGYIKLEHGSPWCVSSSSDDTTVKLRQINITMTYYTM